MTKYVFVTDGVVSSLGKGIAAASLAALLETRSIKVTMLKLDPCIHVNPATMSPFQRGGVESMGSLEIYSPMWHVRGQAVQSAARRCAVRHGCRNRFAGRAKFPVTL